MIWIPVAIAALALALLIVVVWQYRRSRRMTAALRARVEKQWAKLQKQADPQRQVLDAEKVVDGLLGALGYRGTFAEKFTRFAPRIASPTEVWWAHRLRNRIAHEVDVTVSAAEAKRAVRAFAMVLAVYGLGKSG